MVPRLFACGSYRLKAPFVKTGHKLVWTCVISFLQPTVLHRDSGELSAVANLA